MKFIFFGSSPISVSILEALKEIGLTPSLIVTKPDKPKGRGLEIHESIVKTWSKEQNIPYITPEKIRTSDFESELKAVNAEFAILVSYGKIIPQNIIDLFPKGIINVHPSLLPKLRGPSPFEFTILNDMKDEVGVSIMLLDSGMDSGPIIAQKKVDVPYWPISKHILYEKLTKEGAALLTRSIHPYLQGSIIPTKQEDTKVTYSRMIEKQDGEISIDDDGYKNYLKYLAFEGWPGTFFFFKHQDKKIRLKITDAIYTDSEFKILKVIPEGKKETSFDIFCNSLK